MYSSKLPISKRFSMSVSGMEYFMNPFMCCQFNVYNMVEKSVRIYLPGALYLSTFISKLLVFMGHTLANKKSSQKFWICKFLGLSASMGSYIYTLMTIFASNL